MRMPVRQVVDAVGNELSLAWIAEIVIVGLDGLLREGLAGTMEIPSNSFFFVSMLMTGSLASKYSFRNRAMFSNWALRSG